MMERERTREYRDAEERDEKVEYGVRDENRNEPREEVDFSIPRD